MKIWQIALHHLWFTGEFERPLYPFYIEFSPDGYEAARADISELINEDNGVSPPFFKGFFHRVVLPEPSRPQIIVINIA